MSNVRSASACGRMQVNMMILLFITLVGVTGVHIQNLSVPPVIRNGTEEYVTLDCDYTLEEDEGYGLVVKWFFGELPVYQWIPNQRPQDLGILRGKVNLNYTASQDKYKMHRALQILRPTANLSGLYLCRVSTFYGEAYKAASMIVFAPEKDMGMKVVDTLLPGHINISCWASGVYPEPRLTVYHGENKEQKIDDMVIDTRWNKGAYDIIAYRILADANLSTFYTVFDCELTIPRTDYVARRSTFYEPGSLELKQRSMANSRGVSRMQFSGGTFTFQKPLLFCTTLTFLFLIKWFHFKTVNGFSSSTST